MIQQTISTNNEKQGNGRYTPLRKRNKQNAQTETQEFSYLDSADRRMRFNTSRDPIYFTFEYIKKRSLSDLACDFVKDSFSEMVNFVSKAVK